MSRHRRREGGARISEDDERMLNRYFTMTVFERSPLGAQLERAENRLVPARKAETKRAEQRAAEQVMRRRIRRRFWRDGKPLRDAVDFFGWFAGETWSFDAHPTDDAPDTLRAVVAAAWAGYHDLAAGSLDIDRTRAVLLRLLAEDHRVEATPDEEISADDETIAAPEMADDTDFLIHGIVRGRIEAISAAGRYQACDALRAYYGPVGARFELGDVPVELHTVTDDSGAEKVVGDPPEVHARGSANMLPRVYSLLHLTQYGPRLIELERARFEAQEAKKRSKRAALEREGKRVPVRLMPGTHLELLPYDRLRLFCLFRGAKSQAYLEDAFARAEVECDLLYREMTAAWLGLPPVELWPAPRHQAAEPARPAPEPPAAPPKAAPGERSVEVTLVVCGRQRGKACGCGAPAAVQCGYALRGAKAGQACGAWLCAACAWDVQGAVHCAAHARSRQREAKHGD